jgi:hypothetical protein
MSFALRAFNGCAGLEREGQASTGTEVQMKKVLMLAALGLFTAGVVGCHASGDIDSSDANSNTSTYKKTEYKDNGDTKTTKTEVKTERSY